LHFRYDYALYGPKMALVIEDLDMPYWTDASEANFARVVLKFENGEPEDPDLSSRLMTLEILYCHMLKELLVAHGSR